MTIYHCAMKIVSRGKGRSAVATAVYRAGEKIENNYDGTVHDYTKKKGIFHTEILLPQHAPLEFADRSTLWNTVERVEKKKNAQLARDIEVTIPVEIPQSQWVPLMKEYCIKCFVSRGMIADVCIHDKQDGNPHCHILLTLRPLHLDGSWGEKSKLEYVLGENGQKIKLQSGNYKTRKIDTTDWNRKENAELWCTAWAEICNTYLKENDKQTQIDHRSYERQGVDKAPTIHMGVTACQMEQHGIPSKRGDINRKAIAQNGHAEKVLRARISRLMAWQKELKTKPLASNISNEAPLASTLNLFQWNTVRSKYQKIRDLKNDVAVWKFLNKNQISSLEDYYKKITCFNKDFYALQGAIKTVDQQTAYYERYPAKISRGEVLLQQWRSFQADGDRIFPKQWAREVETLTRQRGLLEWKMQALGEELRQAEQVRKGLERVMAVETPRRNAKEKRRGEVER